MVKKAKMENGGHLDVGASKRFETMRDYSKDAPIPQHRRLAMGEKVDGTTYPAEDNISLKPTTGGNGRHIKGAW